MVSSSAAPAAGPPAAPEDAVRATAVELAAGQAGKAGPVLGTIKSRMYATALATLRDRIDPLS